MNVVGSSSGGVAAIAHITELLGVREVVNLATNPLASVDAVVGWGRKFNTNVGRMYAAARGVPFIRLEDGFVRSVALGVEGAAPMSIVIDPVGMYYDSTRPSRLENILAERDADSGLLCDANLRARARALIGLLRETGISKYNGGSDEARLPPTDRRRVLVVDQTDRDLSLRLGGAMPGGLRLLTSAALDENPDAEVIVKIHPDVISGLRGGHENEIPRDPRVRIVSRWVQPAALLREVEDVYVMTSQLGFDALIHGHAVHCFGKPFYSGWSLTNDRVPEMRRGVQRSLEELVIASLILYPTYVDFNTKQRCEVETVVHNMVAMRQVALREPTGARILLPVGARSPVT